MKRFWLIFAAFLGLYSCGGDKIDMPVPDPGTPVPEEDDIAPSKVDTDVVDWAAALDYVFDASALP